MNDPWWDNKSYDVVAMLFIHGIGMFAVELTSNLWVQGAIIIPASLGTLAFFLRRPIIRKLSRKENKHD